MSSAGEYGAFGFCSACDCDLDDGDEWYTEESCEGPFCFECYEAKKAEEEAKHA